MNYLRKSLARLGTFLVDAALLLALLALIYLYVELSSKNALRVAPESTKPAFEVEKVIPKMGQ